jgi:hypothetical protein
MENYSFETVELVRELADERQETQREQEECQKRINERCPGSSPLPPLAGQELKTYVIELNFEEINDPQEQACFLHLPTSFALTRRQVDALLGIAGELLDAHPRFQELLQDLKAESVSTSSRGKATRCQEHP